VNPRFVKLTDAWRFGFIPDKHPEEAERYTKVHTGYLRPILRQSLFLGSIAERAIQRVPQKAFLRFCNSAFKYLTKNALVIVIVCSFVANPCALTARKHWTPFRRHHAATCKSSRPWLPSERLVIIKKNELFSWLTPVKVKICQRFKPLITQLHYAFIW